MYLSNAWNDLETQFENEWIIIINRHEYHQYQMWNTYSRVAFQLFQYGIQHVKRPKYFYTAGFDERSYTEQ